MASAAPSPEPSAGRPSQERGWIRADGVGRRYRMGRKRDVHAVADVDLEVLPGEFVALLGPSGCGKSTLLRLIAGLEAPDTGALTVDGLQADHLARDHRLGMAFQDHALLPWLTVRANVELPFRLAHRRVERATVDALLELVGLTDFATARPSQLSGGMRQRAAIARSLVLDPDLLLLDEPFGALDAVTRRRLNEELQRIWLERRVTTVLVTHAVDEAVFLADRVIVLTGSPGRVHTTMPVPFERPRPSSLQFEPAFQRLCARLHAALADAPDISGDGVPPAPGPDLAKGTP
jgi:NitT/TauT family transport system ATP-binding protein